LLRSEIAHGAVRPVLAHRIPELLFRVAKKPDAIALLSSDLCG
jgi:hypothetical protein